MRVVTRHDAHPPPSADAKWHFTKLLTRINTLSVRPRSVSCPNLRSPLILPVMRNQANNIASAPTSNYRMECLASMSGNARSMLLARRNTNQNFEKLGVIRTPQASKLFYGARCSGKYCPSAITQLYRLTLHCTVFRSYDTGLVCFLARIWVCE